MHIPPEKITYNLLLTPPQSVDIYFFIYSIHFVSKATKYIFSPCQQNNFRKIVIEVKLEKSEIFKRFGFIKTLMNPLRLLLQG